MADGAVAWYGAIVSTASLSVATYVALRDRAWLRISASKNMKILGSVYERDEASYVAVTVANRGRRPVFIKAVGLQHKEKGKGEFLLTDSVRGGPTEISEGKSHTFTVKQDLVPVDEIAYVVVADQAGRSWRKRVRL